MLSKETVLIHLQIELSLQILDVETGIGKIKFASHAPKDGHLMRTKYVYQYQINATLKMRKVIVPHVIRDMI